MADKPAKASVKRPMTDKERKLLKRNYAQYRRMGLPTKEAYKWAWRIAMLAKDHWSHPPQGGW